MQFNLFSVALFFFILYFYHCTWELHMRCNFTYSFFFFSESLSLLLSFHLLHLYIYLFLVHAVVYHSLPIRRDPSRRMWIKLKPKKKLTQNSKSVEHRPWMHFTFENLLGIHKNTGKQKKNFHIKIIQWLQPGRSNAKSDGKYEI